MGKRLNTEELNLQYKMLKNHKDFLEFHSQLNDIINTELANIFTSIDRNDRSKRIKLLQEHIELLESKQKYLYQMARALKTVIKGLE